MDINEFPPGVIEHLGWYVYRLIDPRDGSTFYVGKGKGNRVFAHMRGEVAAADDDELLSNKLKQLREIRLAGLEVIHVIHRHGIADEKTAYEVEAALIDAYPGLTNIMNGAGSNEYGAAHIKEWIGPYISRHFLSLNPLLVRRRRYSRGERYPSALCGCHSL